jgi:hypothetical protein
MFHRRFPWRGIGFFGLACLAVAGFYAFPRSPARAVVQPSNRREIAKFSSKITVTYQIFNEGGRTSQARRFDDLGISHKSSHFATD